MRRPGAGTKGYREAAEDTTATLRVHESGPRVEARVDVLAFLGMRHVVLVGESSVRAMIRNFITIIESRVRLSGALLSLVRTFGCLHRGDVPRTRQLDCELPEQGSAEEKTLCSTRQRRA